MKTVSTILALSALATTFVAAHTSHKSGGAEHIVIIDNQHPTPPAVAEVLERLELNEGHPDVRYVFNNSAFRGFAASMKSHCLDLLANMSDVSMVEQTMAVTHAAAVPVERRASASHWDTRDYAPWGLQRISTASFAGDASKSKSLDYTYSYSNEGLGKGADIYIVDTGLYAEHVVFGGRAKQIWTFDGNNSVVDGHGTHVAGTAGGETLGVASNANVLGIRALSGDGSGWSSNVVAGIDFVMQEHDRRKADASKNGHRGSVLSMSLASGGVVESIDKALAAAIQNGVHVVVAAGNAGTDACSGSPSIGGGLRGGAITVGSVGITGKRSDFSNYGNCVDVYAPGEDIISAWLGGPENVNVLSGTSMATPHVTGIVAYAMANSTLANDPALMKEWIRMQGLALPDGTILANNGVLGSSTGRSSSGMLGFSRRMAPVFTTVPSADSPLQKRALGDGFNNLVSFFMNLFGGKKHHRRSELKPNDEETDELRLRLSAILLAEAISSATEIEKRAISGDGINNLVSWFMNLFGKKHRKRDEGLSDEELARRSVCDGFSECVLMEESPLDKRAISGDAINNLVSWFMNLFGKKHHKRDSETVIHERGISGDGINNLVAWFMNLFGKKHHKRSAELALERRSVCDGLEECMYVPEEEMLEPEHEKRAISGDGINNLVSWFMNLFGKKHHKRSYFDAAVAEEFDTLLAARSLEFEDEGRIAKEKGPVVQYRGLVPRAAGLE